MNDDQFIEGLRNQDPEAAQRLHECYVPMIWRFVYFRVDQNSHLAEDITSDTILALVDAASSGKSVLRPLSWLRTVATRRIQDHYRAVARVQKLIKKAEQDSGVSDDQNPATQHDRELQRQTVRDALQELPETYRSALEMKYVDQLSVKVIADQMNTSEKSVESMLFRARGALRKRLQWKDNGTPILNSHKDDTRSRTNGSDASADDSGPLLFTSRLAGEN